MSETTMSKIAHLFTGGYIGDGSETLIPAPPPPSPERVRMLYRAAFLDVKAARSHLEACEEKLAAVRELGVSLSSAHRRALAEEMVAADPPPAPPREPEPMTRVRAIQGFSSEWPPETGHLWHAPEGSVVDIPRALALAAPHMFAILDDQETPLVRVQPAPPR